VYSCSGVGPDCPQFCNTHFDCAPGRACNEGACVPALWAFTTSSTHSGNLGGLAGADAICQARAIEANLPGTYKAWLSSDTVSVATSFSQATLPYYLPNDAAFASNFADLIDGTIPRAFHVDEHGTTVASNIPWTGTNANGTATVGYTCDNWTSNSQSAYGMSGFSEATNYAWTQNVSRPCDVPHRLFCFQQ
jgi:hypothetical protein